MRARVAVDPEFLCDVEICGPVFELAPPSIRLENYLGARFHVNELLRPRRLVIFHSNLLKSQVRIWIQRTDPTCSTSP